MRDALHLVPGTRIQLAQEGETIVLSPQQQGGKLVETHGFLVWHSSASQPEPIDLLNLIEQGREERIDAILGGRLEA